MHPESRWDASYDAPKDHVPMVLSASSWAIPMDRFLSSSCKVRKRQQDFPKIFHHHVISVGRDLWSILLPKIPHRSIGNGAHREGIDEQEKRQNPSSCASENACTSRHSGLQFPSMVNGNSTPRTDAQGKHYQQQVHERHVATLVLPQGEDLPEFHRH
jgi:hypothetical protein